MKILAVHSALLKDHNKQSQVDHWRVYRPMRELAKHTDWQIDHEPSFIPGIEKYKDLKEFTPEEMEKAFKVISGYDIVFSSYHPDPTAYTMLKVAADKTGTQFVMDVDDDMFAINPDNPFWMKMDDEKVYWMQCMIRDNAWVSTTTEGLAKVFRDRRELPKESVFINPNCISDDYAEYSPDNGEDVVIGYFGGSSHYADLHESGALRAVEKLMHENKKVRFKSVGMVVDKYIPRGRYTFEDGKRGTKWMSEVFPTLNMDIALGPLADNIFNHGKSDIKWQEATRAGAAFVGSRIGPYAGLSRFSASLAMNTPESWYAVLKKLVEDTEFRKQQVENARRELEGKRLETNWQSYERMFTTIKEKSRANHSARPQAAVL
jgi:hypothetical protein